MPEQSQVVSIIQALQAYKTHPKEQGRAHDAMVVVYCITLVKRLGKICQNA